MTDFVGKVVGLDLSLTSTGFCEINIKGPDPATDLTVHLETLTSAPPKKDEGFDNVRLYQRARRIRALRNGIIDACRGATVVVVEAPLYSPKTGGSQHDRSGLWWAVLVSLEHLGIPVVEVSPPTLKKFCIGKGTGAGTGKADVAAALTRLWPESYASAYGDDQYDALGLATAGAVKLAGRQLPCVILDRHRLAIAKLDWAVIPCVD